MRCKVLVLVAGLAATVVIGTANADEPTKAPAKGAKAAPQPTPKKDVKGLSFELEGTMTLRLVEPPKPPSIYGYGTPYTAGPPAYGWGYGWGNPWPANWGPAYVGHKLYNFKPYYEPHVLPPHVHVITFVHPPAPFVPVNQLPGAPPQGIFIGAPRKVQIEFHE